MLKLTNKIVYKAEDETNNGINELSAKVNFVISDTEFTSKCNSRIMSLRNLTHENDSELVDQNRAIFASWKSL